MAKKVANKVTPTSRAVEAIRPLLADPTPRKLFGTKASPGIFGTPQSDQAAATACLDNGWLKDSGETLRVTKTKVEKLYAITDRGIEAVLAEMSEPPPVLSDILAALDRYATSVREHAAGLQRVEQVLAQQKATVEALKAKYKPPVISPRAGPAESAPWENDALAFIDKHRQGNPLNACPLPDLFDAVAKPRGLTIGQFHDGLRELTRKGAIELKPFTRPGHELRRGDLALIADQEIKYYVERSRK